MNQSNQAIVENMNRHSLPFVKMFGGEVIAADRDAGTCSFSFDVGHEFCHSVDIIQGGFITAMMDMAMSHAVFAARPEVVNVASLEIKVSFLEPSRAGKLRCDARVVKNGRSTAFLDAELFDEQGLLTAVATSTAKLVVPRN